MLNIFQRFNIKPATGASMLRVPGDFRASVELDISQVPEDSLETLIAELQGQKLTVNRKGKTLEVSGSVEFSFSRGIDQDGRKAIWISAEGPIVELIGLSLAYIYVSRGWRLTTGRVMREIVARTGGEIRLPDGATIYVGESEDYNQSLLSTDGCWVHPKFALPSTDSQGQGTTIEVEDDPFK